MWKLVHRRLATLGTSKTGLYIHGGVGIGKTFAMDTFVARAVASATGASFNPLDAEAMSFALGMASRPEGVAGIRRIHHHALTTEIHERMHYRRHHGPASDDDRDVVELVCADIAAGATAGTLGHMAATDQKATSRVSLLAVDELQVYDAADAALLGRVLSVLATELGVALVVTSNRHPAELFSHGLNRDLIRPLTEALMTCCRIVDMETAAAREPDAPQLVSACAADDCKLPQPTQLPDHRRAERDASGLIVWPADPSGIESGAHCALRIARLASMHAKPDSRAADQRELAAWLPSLATVPLSLPQTPWFQADVLVPVGFGRAIRVPAASEKCLWAPFSWLCGVSGELGPVDYRALFTMFHTLALPGVPALGYALRNEARRLITAVDIAYEEGVLLVAELGEAPDELFAELVAQTAAGAPEDAELDWVQRRALQQQQHAAGQGQTGAFTARVVGRGGSSSSSSTTVIGDDGFEWSATGRKGAALGDVAALADTVFAQSRTASRLIEMASADYAARHAARHGYTIRA